jgi:hypothetical protein
MDLNLTPEQELLIRATCRKTALIMQEEMQPAGLTGTPGYAYGNLPSTVYNHLLELHRQNEIDRMAAETRRQMGVPFYPMSGTAGQVSRY